MMRAFLIHTGVILITAFVFLMSGASVHHNSLAQVGTPAPAAAPASEGSPGARNLSTIDETGRPIKCADIAEAKQGVLLGYIVPCVTRTIESTTMRMSAAMIDWLKPAIYAFITLTIVLYGVRILQGGGQVHTEGILLLLKIGIVIALLELIPTRFVPMLYDVMNQSISIVSGAISPDESAIYCDMEKYSNPEASVIWSQMDCLAGKLFGITTGSDGPNGEKRPNMLLGASIFGFLGGFFFGGTFGFILFMTLVGVLWSMFMLILRTTTAFLNGYLYASLLLIITPLFLPLVLMKATTQYFEPWWKGILAGIMLPIVICAYAMFALLLYDKMLFNDGSKNPADKALLYKLFDNKLVKDMQALPKPICDMQRVGDSSTRAEALGMTQKQLAANPFLNTTANPLLRFGNDQCGGFAHPSVELMQGMNTSSNKEAFVELFKESIKLLVLALLINMGYGSIAALARRLIGSGGVASSMDARGPIENKIAAMNSSVQQSINSNFKNKDGTAKSGTDFITSLATVPRALGTGISRGLGKE